MQRAVPVTVMRGGTSKGLYFDKADLPTDIQARDCFLLAAMGSADQRQIDGMGGAHPLTSKVAVISASKRDDADVDYLFLQVGVDNAEVRDNQNCGNILAGVGPWAIEQRYVQPQDGVTKVRIHMVNTGALAVAEVQTPGGEVVYDGDARIDGVSGTAAPLMLEFLDVVGASCGALLPTGQAKDVVEGVDVTCIDNGMPVVLLRASDLGVSGSESPAELEGNQRLRDQIEDIRLKVGPMMNLGDVSRKTVPKMILISSPKEGGIVQTRSFIPFQVHEAIGVLGAVSVASGCIIKGSVANGLAAYEPKQGLNKACFDVEHPTGFFSVEMVFTNKGGAIEVQKSALLRTARKLMAGEVFVPAGCGV